MSYLKPLFKKLRNKSIQDDISDSLTIITRHLLDRNYVAANDAYLQVLDSRQTTAATTTVVDWMVFFISSRFSLLLKQKGLSLVSDEEKMIR